jgi:hypothetical protein
VVEETGISGCCCCCCLCRRATAAAVGATLTRAVRGPPGGTGSHRAPVSQTPTRPTGRGGQAKGAAGLRELAASACRRAPAAVGGGQPGRVGGGGERSGWPRFSDV